MIDPLTNKTIDPHGYANVTMVSASIPLLSLCLGILPSWCLCEVCPKDILTIALIFLGVLSLSVL